MVLTLFLLGGCLPKEQAIRHRLIYNCDGSIVIMSGMFKRALPLTVRVEKSVNANIYIDNDP